MKKYLLSPLWLVIAVTAFGADLGTMAKGLNLTFRGASTIVQTICFLIGVGIVTTAVIKYIEHRRNPEEVTWPKIIFLLILGIAFIAVSFIPMPK